MKIGLMSDLHGYLPEFDKEVDVVGICGDIFPLEIQRDTIKCVVWFTKSFVPWAEKLNCEKVLFIAGNHDFALQNLVRDYFKNTALDKDESYIESSSADLIKDKLQLPKKIVYLQDTSYSFNHVNFYGTPWVPDLYCWAFYKSHDDLKEVFSKIPDDCNVLLSHAPGTENDMGTSLWFPDRPKYGCQELTDVVNSSNIKLWSAGHVHTGNHEVDFMSNGVTLAVNVSLKDENYKNSFQPLVVEI